MGRHKGSLNRREDSMILNAAHPEPKEQVHYDCVMGVRALRNGPFRGLWELVLLDDNMGRKQVLTDANSRGMIINIMNRQIMKIVVLMDPLVK